MTTQLTPDEIRTRVLTENTAQSVLNHLKALESNRAHMRTRWIWELLQNARDTSVDTDTDLVVSIEHKPGELVFQHNGSRFKIDEIAHLIYHGSTKIEDAGTIGQYGSGFLTTHLLSPEINISGHLNDGRSFVFRLNREIGSVQELSESMDRAWEDFNAFSPAPKLGGFTTQFRYPIEDDAVDAIDNGLAMLKRCAPFVVVFNEKFSRIDIKTPNENTSFEVTKRSPLSQARLEKIEVSEHENENQNNKVYLMAKNEKTAVAIPLESMGDSQVCLPINDIPKLFLGFPIVGTEHFSFPTVINSFEFTPTEERDGVFLGRNEIDKANIENQAIIVEACELLICLLRFVASPGWRNTYTLANVPPIRETPWLNPIWLQDTLKGHLIEKIRQTPAVLNETGDARAPEEATLPLADTDADVKILWDLLDGWQGNRAVLPRRNEAIGWCNAVKSWAMVSECEVSSFNEVIDGCKLASRVDEVSHDPLANPRTHRLSSLDLKKGISAIDWLDRLIAFLKANGLSEVINQYRIVPSQESYLRTFSKLYRDQDIAEELKDIAELLGWRVRPALREKCLTSLSDEVDTEGWDNDYIFGQLIKKLQERAEKNPDDNFTKASARLFAWMVKEKNWDLLGGFPMFAEEIDSDKPTIIYLPRTTDDGERPLAPIRAWPGDLQQFSELFPQRYILSDAFFELVPDLDVWQTLDEQGFLKKDVIITKNLYFDTFLPDEPLPDTNEVAHETTERITTTNIAFLTREDIGIMARVRQSRRLARIFWRFLTEWLIVHDSKGLEIKKVLCDCKQEHHYYPAEWLVPLVKNKWVPLGERRASQAMAKSLAGLIRGSDREIISLRENNEIAKLLKALGIKPSDLMLEIVAEDTEIRATLESTIIDMVATTGGNVGHLNHVRDYIEDLKNDENLPNVLENHRKQRKKVRENQHLGQQVEKLVKDNLEKEGFAVKRKPIGSDFEIEYDSVENDKEMGIELVQGGQSWLVEVKATRNQEVQMTSTQAQTAKKEKDNFLLCVVPLGPGDIEPELDAVRAKMRFIKDIGIRVTPLCDDLDTVEKLQAKIAADPDPNVQLKLKDVSGTARICVANSVWETDGLLLENLAKELK